MTSQEPKCAGWQCIIRERCRLFGKKEDDFFQGNIIPEHPGAECEQFEDEDDPRHNDIPRPDSVHKIS